MAMRLFSKNDFYAELKRRGLEPTGFTAGNQELWALKDDPARTVFVVTDQERIPDYVLDTILQKLNRLYHPEGPAMENSFLVHPTAEVIELKTGKAKS